MRARDIEEFFSSVGKIRDTKLIMCNKTRRFKGIAYVEFKDMESVPLALGLNGQKLLGVPVIVQPSQAEKNRVTTYGADSGLNATLGHPGSSLASGMSNKGPMRLYVGSLHFNITEDMLRGIFEPFGKDKLLYAHLPDRVNNISLPFIKILISNRIFLNLKARYL